MGHTLEEFSDIISKGAMNTERYNENSQSQVKYDRLI